MSERVFRVGQRVVIVWPNSPLFGTVTEIAGPASPFAGHPDSSWLGEVPVGTLMYPLAVESRHPTGFVAYPATGLEPYRDDGREPAEWSDSLRRFCGLSEDA